MHLNVHAHELKSVISRISTIVDKKNTRPILSCILLVAKNNHLQLSCTDQEVAAQIFISAEIFEEGSFCVNAKNLSDVLRDFPDSIISISFNDQENILKIQNENINFSLVGFNDTQFPLLFFGDKQPSFEIPAYELLRIINKTSYAISIDETRPYLNGIYLQQIDSKLRSVATDGYRLSLLDIEDFNSNITEYMSNGIIIPKKAVVELKKMAENYLDKNFKMSVDESFIYASVDNLDFLSSRLISREYVKYQAVIPSKVSYVITADKNLLLNAVQLIRLMSDEKTNGIRLAFLHNEMHITAKNPSLGHGVEKIPVEYDDKEIELGLNARYLIDLLSAFESNEIQLELKNEFGPILVKSLDEQNFLGVIMPFKL